MRRLLPLLALTAAARAQPVADFQQATAYVVPELGSAWTLDLGYDARFDAVRAGSALGLPSEGYALTLGWLDYRDPWGEWALGPTLSGAVQLSQDDAPASWQAKVGMRARRRFMSLDFVYLTLGAYAEAGLLVVPEQNERWQEEVGAGRGLVMGAGLETGPGLLFSFAPFIFGDWLARFGVEAVHIGGQDSLVVTGGLRLTFDWAKRAPDRPDCDRPPCAERHPIE